MNGPGPLNCSSQSRKSPWAKAFVGLIIAFSAAGQGGTANPDEIKPMIAAVVNGMYVSLYATLLGIGTNLWLKINLRLLGNFHG